ncbi:MAG: hypothetical protein RL344_28 [Pseudomonadota bacterium]|jgi:hypothetical protein
MIQLWKVKREVNRIKQQTHALGLIIFEPLIRYQYNKNIDKNRLVSQGIQQSSLTLNHGFGKKVALFLIYQPKGISYSTYQTCQHLINKGYSVLAVCNHALNENDKEKLAQQTTQFIERPNFGYDFGGYRDGILYLKSLNITISNLIIINDSIWYPVIPEDTLIERMEYSSASFLGALHMSSEKKYLFKVKKTPFFGSFLLMIKQDIYELDLFLQFWKTYPCSDSKYLTIKRGEQALSTTLLKHAFKSEYFYDKSMVYQYIDHANRPELVKLLKNSVIIDNKLAYEKADALEKEKQLSKLDISLHNITVSLKEQVWVNDAKRLLKKISGKQNILSTLPILPFQQFGVSYLKKSLDPHNRQALNLIIQEHINVQLNLYPTVLKEIKERLK